MGLVGILTLVAFVASASFQYKRMKNSPKVQCVTDLATFESLLTSDLTLQQLSKIKVIGNTSFVKDDHPVVQAILQRWRDNSKPGKRIANDHHRIALAIEGNYVSQRPIFSSLW